MKKVLSLVIAAIVVVAISSCGGKKDTPEAVAEKYLNHLNKKEFAEAKKLATEETGQMLDMMQSFSGVGGAQEVKEVKIENLKCETTEDKSACKYTADGKEETLDLVKKDGKWLVEQKKEGTGEDIPVEDTTAVDTTAAVE
ncbi:MAG: hypothetical protein PHR81_02885 [Bacteroidales bacterium]|jgi:hypothetical protein|nr:hypothetical protein [Bacteroidales bacterium]MDD4213734.1 hypothetical protein [Bacteroidales bacterium]